MSKLMHRYMVVMVSVLSGQVLYGDGDQDHRISSLEREIRSVRHEMRSDISGVRRDVHEVRGEMKTLVDRIQSDAIRVQRDVEAFRHEVEQVKRTDQALKATTAQLLSAYEKQEEEDSYFPVGQDLIDRIMRCDSTQPEDKAFLNFVLLELFTVSEYVPHTRTIYVDDSKVEVPCERNAREKMHDFFWQKRASLMQMLIEHGASIDLRDDYANTLLIRSVFDGDSITAAFLLDHGVPVNAMNNDGDSALHLAVRMQNYALVSLLLEHRASVNSTNKLGDTPLLEAAYAHDAQLVELLRRHNAFENTRNNKGISPAMEVARRNYSDLAFKFTHHDDILFGAVWGGHRRLVREALEKQANPNVRGVHDKTPLIVACENNDIKTAELLLAAGAGAQIDAADASGNCALSIAYSTIRNKKLVKLLLRHGANTAVYNADGDRIDELMHRASQRRLWWGCGIGGVTAMCAAILYYLYH